MQGCAGFIRAVGIVKFRDKGSFHNILILIEALPLQLLAMWRELGGANHHDAE